MDKTAFLAKVRKQFEQAEQFEHEDRILMQEDFAFAAGDGQWPDDIEQERTRRGQPCLRLNRFPQFIRQITGDARQNAPSIKVHPVDDDADDETAEILEGLIRNIEAQSQAQTAYMTALDHAVRGGMGHWRIHTEYNEEGFDQDIFIRRITNPMAVYWDPQSQNYDKSDAKWCFVCEWYTKEAFEEQWPKQTPDDWTVTYRGVQNLHLWTSVDRVMVAEYWVKEPFKKTIGQLESGAIVDLTDLKEHVQMLPMAQTPTGRYVKGVRPDGSVGDIPEMRPKIRTVNSHKVKCYKLTAHDILEEYEWAGKYIPIISVFGPEEFIGDRTRRVSLIRHSKDAQRMYNYWKSSNAEKIALAPKQPFIGATQQFEGLETKWSQANNSNLSFLAYKHVPGVPPPQRQQPAMINQAEIMESQGAVDDMKATMGLYDASLGHQGNETSGRAIIARQREGDTATFDWIDNLARSIEYTGRILIDAIPKYYDSERIVRVLGEDNTAELVPINQVVGGQLVNDLTVGKYDIVISVGPSYATKRAEAADSMLQFIQAVPAAGQIAGDLIAKNMDWPGADELADRLKKLLPPGMEEPKDMSPEEQQQYMEAQELAQQKQDDAEQIARQMAIEEGKIKAATADKLKAETEELRLANQLVRENWGTLVENTVVPTNLGEALNAEPTQSDNVAA